MKHEFHPDAEQEFIEAAALYEREVPGLGERFGGEVHRAIELLLERPELAPRIDGNVRRFVLRRFPFAILYTFTSEMLHVLAVAHGHRMPEYWRARIAL